MHGYMSLFFNCRDQSALYGGLSSPHKWSKSSSTDLEKTMNLSNCTTGNYLYTVHYHLSIKRVWRFFQIELHFQNSQWSILQCRFRFVLVAVVHFDFAISLICLLRGEYACLSKPVKKLGFLLNSINVPDDSDILLAVTDTET